MVTGKKLDCSRDIICTISPSTYFHIYPTAYPSKPKIYGYTYNNDLHRK